VISAGEHLDATTEEFFGQPRRDAEAGGNVLAVRDAEIDRSLSEDIREPVMYDLASGRTYDVADEEDFQRCSFAGLVPRPYGVPVTQECCLLFSTT
jgi:hypothetical protein